MSAALARPRNLTAVDFLAMDHEGYELVDGAIEERELGAESSFVGTRLIIRLGAFVEERGLGIVIANDAGVALAPAPDLAFAVVSPNDRAHQLNRKIDEYLNAGIRLVWVIDPEWRKAQVWRTGAPVAVLGESDALDGTDVVPGFRCLLRDILPVVASDTAEIREPR